MSITTGIDIVNVDRIRELIQQKKGKVLQRVFSDKEITYCEKKVNKYQHYAARFAAKEAFLKALPQSATILTYKDIEVYKELNAPYIRISSERRGKVNTINSSSVSIAHEKEFAIAVVVLEIA